MRETLIIIQREFLERVRTDTFVLGTLLLPALVIAGEMVRIAARGSVGDTAPSAIGAAFGLGVLAYAFILLFGLNVMRSVLEEKSSRLVEVLVSSARAPYLMIAKIVGVGAVALVQLAIWALFLMAGVVLSRPMAPYFGVLAEALGALRVEPMVGMALAAFFVGGFLLYAALFAAAGAAVNSESEAQRMVTVMLLPLLLPLLFIVPVLTNPQGGIAFVLGMLPLTAPVVMPMRLVATSIPAWQIVASLVVMAITVAAVTWLAGRIYRVGILRTGTRPTLRELEGWVRAA